MISACIAASADDTSDHDDVVGAAAAGCDPLTHKVWRVLHIDKIERVIQLSG